MAGYEGPERRQIPRTPVSEVSWKKYNVPTTVLTRSVTTAAGKKQLVPPNPNRVSYLIINNSDTVVQVLPNADVSSDFGIPLTANGGSFGMKIEDEGEAVISGLHSYCSQAGKYLTFVETVTGGG